MRALDLDPAGADRLRIDSFPVSGGLVLRSRGCHRLVLLNEVAAVVWELFAAGLDAAGIADALAQRFDEPRAEMAARVEALVSAWRAGLFDPPAASADSPRAAVAAPGGPPLVDTTIRLARVTIRVRSFVPEIGLMVAGRLAHHRVAAASPDCTIDIHPAGHDFVGLCNGDEVVREDDVPHAVSSLYRLFLRLDNPEEAFLVFMHAACLEFAGRPLLACGCGGRGKTTLAAGLLSKGWTYLGDEIAGVVARDFSIRSLPTALSIKTGGMAAVSGLAGAPPASWPSAAGNMVDRFIDPGTLGPTADDAPRPAALVFPRFSTGGDLAAVRLTPLEAFAELIDAGVAADNSLFGTETPARLIEFVETTPCYRLTYGSFDEAYRGVRIILGG